MKTLHKLSFLALLLVAFGCKDDAVKPASENLNAPIPVEVATVAVNGNASKLQVSGKVQAVNSADLSTRIMGYVDRVYVNVGDKVKQGQLLIAINNADLQAKLAQVNASIAEATVAFDNAKKDYQRFQNLFVESSATQKELDDMKAHFQMAQARLTAAKQMRNEVQAQFTYAKITAPFNGVVTHKSVKQGDMANPGMPLISVEGPKQLEVVAMVPESEIAQVKSNTEVTVLVASINKVVSGLVTEVSTSAKHTGGQYLVKVTIKEADDSLRSGMFATVEFPVESTTKAQDRVLIPVSALVERGQLKGVYTISHNNTAILRWLRLGKTYGNTVEVLSGLSANEQYIVSHQGKLQNGTKVEVR